MTRRFVASIAFALLVLVAVCGCPSEPRTALQVIDSTSTAEVESTLVRFSVALAAGDSVALRALMLPSFVLIDEGRTYDRAGTISSVRQVLKTGTMTRTPIDMRIERRGDFAWATYGVRGEFHGTLGPLPLVLLESAVLVRTPERWCIAQMATMLSAEAPQ